MEKKNKIVQKDTKKTESKTPPKKKLKYSKPKLISYGKLSSLTLGVSIPDAESGMTETNSDPMM